MRRSEARPATVEAERATPSNEERGGNARYAPSPPYSLLAPRYDRLFGDYSVRLNRWLLPFIRRLEPRPTSALDLACGTGTTALGLARVVGRVEAIDLRPEFVRIVKRRARERGRSRVIHAAVGDMRTFKVERPVGLVTCFFDALNHLVEPGDLTAAFAAVHRALEPGGHFLFDVNTPYALRAVWPEMKAIWKGRGWFAVARGQYFRESSHGEFEIHWFERGKDGIYRPWLERFHEVAWSDAEVRTTLRGAGFSGIKVVDDPALDRFRGPESRARRFWLARRA